MIMLFQIIKEAIKTAKRNKLDFQNRKEKELIAKVFNDRYTYRKQYKENMPYLSGTSYGVMPKGGNAWMCPECNKIHFPIDCSVFDGIHYPACCGTPEGHRLLCGIKINT